MITKVSFENFSATTYVNNDEKLVNEFDIRTTPLSSEILRTRSFDVTKESVTFRNNAFYEDNLINW